MTTRTSKWPAGTPCWADLAVPDMDAARAFYGAVLGWTFDESQEEFGGYTVARSGGHQAAGVMPLMQEGQPSAWVLYFATDDADATAALITANEGTLIAEPMDVATLGRMLVAVDPTGAAFGAWQAYDFIGGEIYSEPGGIVWEDLRTPKGDEARAFYGGVFGFAYQSMDMAESDYRTFSFQDSQDHYLGGMGGMFGNDDAPPHWLVYFGVADSEPALAAAEANGGKVIAPNVETPWGRMSALTDPAGATFMIVEMKPRA